MASKKKVLNNADLVPHAGKVFIGTSVLVLAWSRPITMVVITLTSIKRNKSVMRRNSDSFLLV